MGSSRNGTRAAAAQQQDEEENKRVDNILCAYHIENSWENWNSAAKNNAAESHVVKKNENCFENLNNEKNCSVHIGRSKNCQEENVKPLFWHILAILSCNQDIYTNGFPSVNLKIHIVSDIVGTSRHNQDSVRSTGGRQGRPPPQTWEEFKKKLK